MKKHENHTSHKQSIQKSFEWTQLTGSSKSVAEGSVQPFSGWFKPACVPQYVHVIVSCHIHIQYLDLLSTALH